MIAENEDGAVLAVRADIVTLAAPPPLVLTTLYDAIDGYAQEKSLNRIFYNYKIF